MISKQTHNTIATYYAHYFFNPIIIVIIIIINPSIPIALNKVTLIQY